MKNIKLFILIISILVISMISFSYWLKLEKKPSQNQFIKQDNELVDQNLDRKLIKNNNLTKKVKIDKFVPSTIWKDKTLNINGQKLDYKFGDGNPEQVALKPEDYLAKNEEDGMPYVTAEAEKNLLDFLSDKDLSAVLDNCENYNRREMARLNPNLATNQIPLLLTRSDFDIENILTISPETGRKEMNQDILNRISEFLNILSNPLTGTEVGDQCAGSAYMPSIQRIKNKFSIFARSYINPAVAR